MMRVAVSGCGGRMGQALVHAVVSANDMILCGGSEAKGSTLIGMEIGLACGIPPLGLAITDTPQKLLENAQGAIDFTRPEATLEVVQRCAEIGIPLVVGTTGFSVDGLAVIDKAAHRIPLVLSPNMSIGVNVLMRIADEVARILGPDYDLEIIEAHHGKKMDSPSGTALRLAQLLAEATSERGSLADRACHGRRGNIGPRPREEIGIHAVRGGDIIGEHTILFCGTGERLELIHRASSRQTFAQGAIRALRWASQRPAGLYDMRDVLGI
jgi:4-hydroxy-tetrahydrodipicolinate reductase